MPTVRFAGTVTGEKDPNREIRARLLGDLFGAGWNIYNSNGDQRISLSNIQRKIIESDAFLFTPGATLEDLFKAVSIFVGYQTLDKHLAGKPTVLVNTDGSWEPLFSLFSHLNRLGTIRQDHRDYLLMTDDPGGVVGMLEEARIKGHPEQMPGHIATMASESFENAPPPGHMGNVCVFCSASIAETSYLDDGYHFGRLLAEARLGCVSGAGSSGIMGEVVRGAVEAGGWAAGSNVPHIIELEGLPAGLSSFWLKPDIYTRMEVMIDHSDAFVIFPGGAGTVQEMLALMIFKHQRNPAAVGKPVIVYNRRDADGVAFWDPLIEMLRPWCRDGEFVVVEDLDQIIPTTQALLSHPARQLSA